MFQYNNHLLQSHGPVKESLQEVENLPRSTDHFTGREALLNEMAQYFNAEEGLQSLILTTCGLGGVGKTQLALYFAWKCYQNYKGVRVFSAASKEELIDAYIDLGNELNLFTADQKTLLPKKQAFIVKNWLQDVKRTECLLIYDNASKYEDISELLPTKGGKLLITSRYSVGWPGKTIQVDVFTVDEAKEYVEKITNIQDESESLGELVKTLGQLPLALAQACAYIKSEITIKEYLGLYQEAKNALLSETTLPSGDQHEPVMVTWNVTLKKMQVECPDSLDFMYFAAFLHNENIPHSLLEAFFAPEGQSILKIKCNKARATAKKYSMIQVDDQKKKFSLHCLVHEIIRDQLEQSPPGSFQKEEKFNVVLNFLIKQFPEVGKVKDKIDAWPQLATLVPHVVATRQYASKMKFLGEAVPDLGLKLSAYHRERGDYLFAQKLLSQVIDEYKQIFGKKESVKTAQALHVLGSVFLREGYYETAREKFEEALQIKEKIYDTRTQLEVIMALNELGRVSVDEGKYADAEKYLNEVINVFEIPSAENNIKEMQQNLAKAKHTLGRMYVLQKKYSEAKKYLDEAFIIKQKGLKENERTLSIAYTEHALARILHANGDLAEAKNLFLTLLQFFREAHHVEASHPDIVYTLNELGEIAFEEKNYMEAQNYFENSLRSCKEIYSNPNNRDTLKAEEGVNKVTEAKKDSKKRKEPPSLSEEQKLKKIKLSYNDKENINNISNTTVSSSIFSSRKN
jgi:tetratricopeptide (TPR) repeat protein